MSEGSVICSYFGPVGVMSTNEAGIYSLLISRKELKLFYGVKAIVESDSKLVVHLGSSNMDYPWRFADWVEEIQSLSASMFFSFQHVVCDCNSIVDVFARADASRTNLAFEVQFVFSF